jgi:hypothetical protein
LLDLLLELEELDSAKDPAPKMLNDIAASATMLRILRGFDKLGNPCCAIYYTNINTLADIVNLI